MSSPEAAPAHWRRRIFAITWVSYFSYYFTRAPFRATKTSLEDEHGYGKTELMYIDTAYNAAYCIGMFVNGALADWLSARNWVAIGMLTSAGAVFAFERADSFVGAMLAVHMLLWGLNGLAQSTGWPGNAKIMASWNGSEGRARVMGFWSTCYQAGGLVASLFAARLIAHAGWRSVYIVYALWVVVVAIAFWLLARDRPSSEGFRDPDSANQDPAARRAMVRAAWPKVVRNPMVWVMGAVYFCCKFIRYAFIFWLPYYLERAFGYGKVGSNDLAMAFDAGGIVFVILAGQLADRVFAQRRVATACVFLVGLCGALFLYRAVGDTSVAANALGLALVGGCLFAADSLISGAVAHDLGGPHAAALASGMINGMGSIGQVSQGFVLVAVTNAYGWSALFGVFGVLAGVAALLCLPYLRVGARRA